jgi:hypothetical protein
MTDPVNKPTAAEAAKTMNVVYVIRSLVGEEVDLGGGIKIKPWGLQEVRYQDAPSGDWVQTLKKMQDEKRVQVGMVVNGVTSDEIREVALIKQELEAPLGDKDSDDHSKHGDVKGAQMQAAAAGDTGAVSNKEPKTIDGKTPADPHAAVKPATK